MPNYLRVEIGTKGSMVGGFQNDGSFIASSSHQDSSEVGFSCINSFQKVPNPATQPNGKGGFQPFTSLIDNPALAISKESDVRH